MTQTPGQCGRARAEFHLLPESPPAAAPAPAGILTYPDFKRLGYFTALDGIRALSILLVLLHHVPPFATSSALATLQENGRYGVSFFFVVSGFLISTLLLRERDQTGGIGWGKFYGRRALRLLPLYYATLVLQAVLVFVLHQYTPENQALFQSKLPAYLFYFDNWLPSATIGPFFCAWSLNVEEQFYLGFGLLLWLAPTPRVVVALGAALAVKIAAYQIFGLAGTHSALWRIAFSYQEAILWGVLLGFALNNRAVYERCARWLGARLTLFGSGAAIAASLVFYRFENESAWTAEALYVVMTVHVAALVMRRRTRVLTNPVLVHVGKISYGIYLLHTFLISIVKKFPHGADPAVCFALSAPLSIAVASIVYLTFERPIIRYYKKRLSPIAAQQGRTATAGQPALSPETAVLGAPATPSTSSAQ